MLYAALAALPKHIIDNSKWRKTTAAAATRNSNNNAKAARLGHRTPRRFSGIFHHCLLEQTATLLR